MKKLNYLLLGLAGLAMASCSQDEIVNPGANGDGFTVTVQLPGNPGTRAGLDNLSNGLTANVLHYAVYEYNETSETNTFLFEGEADFGQALSTTVKLNLAAGMNYNIAFFAVSTAADGTVYNWYPNPTVGNPYIEVDYKAYDSANNLQDAYDCFYLFKNTGKISTTNNSLSALLQRPVAQINWGANDLNAATTTENTYGENGKYIVSNLTIEDMYTQFDMFNSEVTGETSTININGLASPMSSEDSDGWVYPVLPEQNTFIAMQYVLAPGFYGGEDSDVPDDVQGGVFNVTLNVDNKGNTNGAAVTNEPINVYSCPLQADYRTNIYGSLLSTNTEFTVTKDQNWKSPDYDPSFEWALKNGGTFTLSQDITLSKYYNISKNLTINLNGHNITYDVPGGSDYDENQEGMFYITKGGNLTITGEGNITAENEYTLIWVAGGEVTIEGGTYQAPGEAGNLVYVSEGTANINGGTYILEGQEPEKPLYYPLNCQGKSYGVISFIYVTGGQFYNWNPAHSISEGVNNPVSFLKEGYESIETTINGQPYYVVMPSGSQIADSNESLKDAVSNVGEGGTILVREGTYTSFPNCANLPKDVTIECVEGTVFNVTAANINLNGGTLKGAKFTWSNTGSGSSSTRTITGTLNGNYINCEFTGYEAVRYAYAGETCYFEGCTFSGSLYGCHFDGGANDVTFVDCTFQGFNAFAAAITLLTMDNCTFSANGKASYNGVNLWGTTEMTGCNFEFEGLASTEWIDAKKSLVMTDCFINGVPASDPSVEKYFNNYSNITFN